MPEEINNEEKRAARFEMVAGIIIAFFTAILAINGMAGDSYGSAILLANTEKASTYDWYSSKSIKQTLVENEIHTLEALVDSEDMSMSDKIALKNNIYDLQERVDRYSKEKKEILVGSAALDESEWIQDVDGRRDATR